MTAVRSNTRSRRSQSAATVGFVTIRVIRVSIACIVMAKLIDGRAIADKVYVDLRSEIAELKLKGVTPGLAVILVGDNPASRAYVRSKDKMCRELGLHSVKLELPTSSTQAELLSRVEEFNHDSNIHGILVQSQ